MSGPAAGTHYAGPTWESTDGSRVVGPKLEAATPDAAAIPWLLLRAASHARSLPGSIGVDAFAWAPDGSRIAYSAEQRTVGENELFTVRPDGSDDVVVSGPLVPDGGVVDFRWMSDASRIACRADQLVNGRLELFLAGPGGGPASAAISGPLVDQGDVFAFSTR